MILWSRVAGVSDRSPEGGVDHDELAETLAALAYPARLELLEVLRFPHALGEIRLAPRRSGPSDSPERAAARTTVQAHLDKLVDVDLVRVEDGANDDGRPVQRYAVNSQRLYAFLEEMRRLAVLRPRGAAAADATGTLGDDITGPELKGPRLVLVHGVYEGKAFPLEPSTATDGRWIVGRKRGVAVMLDYDPWVSLENAAITREGNDHFVTDLRGSKNGTTVNWRRLAKDAPRRLSAGDVVGVGRSALVFASD